MAAVWDALMARAEKRRGINVDSRDPDSYDARVARALGALGQSYEELGHVIILLSKVHSLQQVRVILKLYAIGWATLSDLVAGLINEVLDLGYAEQDIELGTLLRNRLVQETRLNAIIKRHRPLVRHPHYVKLRNDVVHRGRLQDPELDEIEREFQTTSYYFSLMREARTFEERKHASDAAAEHIGLAQKLMRLVIARIKSLAEHLKLTGALLDEISAELGAIITKRSTDSSDSHSS